MMKIEDVSTFTRSLNHDVSFQLSVVFLSSQIDVIFLGQRGVFLRKTQLYPAFYLLPAAVNLNVLVFLTNRKKRWVYSDYWARN